MDASYFASTVTDSASARPVKASRGERRDRLRERMTERYEKIRARYDAAQTTDENSKHWLAADALSAKMANSADVRATLRSRARYERDNSSYLKGMVKTFANEVICTGPRLQLALDQEKWNRIVERRWIEWSLLTGYAPKLRTVAEERLIGGEMFGLLSNNPVNGCPVQLNVQLVEGEQVTTPYPTYGDPTAVDGIRFDRFGNPREYDFLPYHPGGPGEFFSSMWNVTPIVYPAHMVLHWFRLERAGQARGIPDVTPALPLIAQLRRYTLAVLMAAELAASFAAIIKTDYPPNTDAPPEVDPFEVADIVRGMFQMLPAGTSMQQFKAEQPVTGYGEFVDKILKETCRCLEMPYGTATGDSSQYNYSSGRLDVQSWQRKVKIERSWHNAQNDRVFNAWAREAQAISGYLPRGLGDPATWRRQWFYDGFEHVDPSKESTATDMALRNLSESLESFYAAKGQDWVEQLNQIAREVELCKKLGIPHPTEMPPAKGAGGAPGGGGFGGGQGGAQSQGAAEDAGGDTGAGAEGDDGEGAGDADSGDE